MCLLGITRDLIESSGARCNGLAPQGLSTPGRILYIDVPWDPYRSVYNFTERHAMFNNPHFTFGTGDFMLSVTVTPLVDGSVIAGAAPLAQLFSRGGPIGSGSQRYFLQVQLNAVVVINWFMEGLSNISTNIPGLNISANLSVGWQAGVSVLIQAGRRNNTSFLQLNNEPVVSGLVPATLDVDSGLTDPFLIGGFFENGRPSNIALDCDLSDLSVQNFADITI